MAVKKPATLVNKSSLLNVAVLPAQLECNLNCDEHINKIGIYNIQGKVYYLQAGKIVNGIFSLPRPKSGTWIINVATEYSNISKTIVLP